MYVLTKEVEDEHEEIKRQDATGWKLTYSRWYQDDEWHDFWRWSCYCLRFCISSCTWKRSWCWKWECRDMHEALHVDDYRELEDDHVEVPI